MRHGIRVSPAPLTPRYLLAASRREPFIDTPAACYECTVPAETLVVWSGRVLCAQCYALSRYRDRAAG